ncbi:MAG TPA: hypothetical protein VL356_09400 [Acidocella sp.]|jgi:hypothetical protein|nr:hypothetical protein [Acidocella sp.]
MTKAKSRLPWPNIALANMAAQGAMLAFEAQQVVGLRLAKMAQGGPAMGHEAALMLTEKLETLTESGQLMVQAALGGKEDLGAADVMQLYRSKVRANRRRLAGA